MNEAHDESNRRSLYISEYRPAGYRCIIEDRNTQTADIEAVGCLPQSLGDILVLVLNPNQLLEVANALFKLGAETYRPLDALA